MPAKKKKIQMTFKYNGFEFRRKYIGELPTRVDAMRKHYKKEGYYTKVKKIGERSALFVSEKKRPGFKVKKGPTKQSREKQTKPQFKGRDTYRNRGPAQVALKAWNKKGFKAEIREKRLAGSLVYQVYTKPGVDKYGVPISQIQKKTVTVDSEGIPTSKAWKKTIPKSRPKPKAKPKAASKPRMTRKRLLETIQRDIKDYEPSGGYDDMQMDHDDKSAGVLFRDLGTWEYDNYGYADDWSDKSEAKYRKEFNEWAKKKPWYKRVDVLVGGSEKAWAGFELRIKRPEKR
jgi:hypothetical protein